MNQLGDEVVIDLTKRQRWSALVVLVLPVLIVSMDSTILGFAVPSLSSELNPTSSQLLWIIDIYAFVLAGLLVTMGALGDRIGRRKLLMIGCAAFSAASILAAFAPSAEALIAARALLGIAGATLMPSTLSIIRNVFTDAREHQTAIAVWATAFAVGAAFGPIIGGFLLEHFWWGSVFLVGVPVTAALLVLAPRLLPESRDSNPEPFDLPSAALSMTTMLPIVYAVKVLAEHGLSVIAFAAAALGVISGVAFVRRQHRLPTPMIDVSLFAMPRFRMAVTGNLLACFGFAGSLFFVTQYLQLVVGFSPMRAGLQLLPAVVSSVLFNLLAPIGARRFGPFAVIAAGLGVGAAGFVLLAQVTVDSSAAMTTLAIVTINAGLGSAMTVAVDGILSAIPPERAGAGASVSETANELGIALGTAVLGSVGAAVYRSNLAAVEGVPAESVVQARETLGGAHDAAAKLGGAAGDALRVTANNAFVDGTVAAATTAAVLLAIASAWAVAVGRARGQTNKVTTVSDVGSSVGAR